MVNFFFDIAQVFWVITVWVWALVYVCTAGFPPPAPQPPQEDGPPNHPP